MVECVAVIFTSKRTLEHDEDYDRWSNRMDELVREQPGFIDAVSIRDPNSRIGITVSYFIDEDSVKLWRANTEHLEAQYLGRNAFYESYSVKVAKVYREYAMTRESTGTATR
ncbi:MAG TPA: antibiotic biosynthesis monooxygenase [Candidatus Nanopelagicaceae bacterium]|nr:antibiotic biosynthesis monooxygenase [Candidatus Nanopelagicaceae bacterium]